MSAAVDSEITEWHRAAKAMGIDAHYRDGLGVDRCAPLETVRGALAAMGAPVSDPKKARLWWESERRREPEILIDWRDGGAACGERGAAYDRAYGDGRAQRFAATKPNPASAQPRVGAFLPLYALRSKRSLGIGDLSDLGALAGICRQAGDGFVATLPLFAVYAERSGSDADRFDPSPYAPISRTFFSELFLDLRALPEGQESAGAEAALRALADENASPYVDYAKVARIRRTLLEPLVERAGDYLTNAPADVLEYARFRARDERSLRYHLYVQLRLREQLQALSERATLYLDLPVGVHRAGFDAARFSGDFLKGFSAGAPPDAMFPSGQCWGISALDPRGARESGYASLRASVETLARYAKLIRLDHVMALHRTFCVPDGAQANEGVYIRARSEELYAALLCAAQGGGASPVLIGEDLGNVPDEVSGALREHGILGMHVAQLDPSLAASGSVSASVNTHDLAPFASYARGDDLRDYAELGFIDPDDLASALNARGALCGDRTYASVRDGLLRGSASHVVINLEDEWGERRPQNTPGTSTERPNFCRRASQTLEDIESWFVR
ncbi:MAG: 4-alpha-glucanotransferase [Myxococcota bacterium]